MTIPNVMHFDFLISLVDKKKRWNKWAKKTPLSKLNIIQEYFSCNEKIALEYLTILTSEQIQEIESTFDTGGLSKKSKKKN